MPSADDTERCIDFIEPLSLPLPNTTAYPSYGSGHDRPLLALSRPVGDFVVDLTTFKEGMPVLCKYIVEGESQGWYKGIIHRIYCNTADIDYDDGDSDYKVSFRNLRHLGVPMKRKFTVDPLPAPEAIVLSIPHAHEAIAHAAKLVKRIRYELRRSHASDFSTPPRSTSNFSTPSRSTPSSDDEVEFVSEGFSRTRGSSERPIIL